MKIIEIDKKMAFDSTTSGKNRLSSFDSVEDLKQNLKEPLNSEMSEQYLSINSDSISTRLRNNKIR
jgi:hypothetical protein